MRITTTSSAIRLWFAADCAFALLPPLDWRITPESRIFGVPTALAYLFGTGAFIAASIVCAYGVDRAMSPGPR